MRDRARPNGTVRLAHPPTSARPAAAACLLLAAGAGGARAQTFDFAGSFGSGVQSGGHFADAEGIATDGAGRVYVVDSTADEVEIYDNAANGNRFLGR